MTRRRNVLPGTALIAMLILSGIAQAKLEAVADTQMVRAPIFQVDPYWPKPIPNGWI
jgi:hypothetical protein